MQPTKIGEFQAIDSNGNSVTIEIVRIEPNARIASSIPHTLFTANSVGPIQPIPNQ